MNPDRRTASNLRQAVESEGDQLADLHLWRLGPGHLGAIISVITTQRREADYYRARLAHFKSLSHLTVEVLHVARIEAGRGQDVTEKSHKDGWDKTKYLALRHGTLQLCVSGRDHTGKPFFQISSDPLSTPFY